MKRDVLAFAARNMERGRRVALVTVTATRGSSPASQGQMMAVLEDGASAGTVGGGASEHRVIGMAVAALCEGKIILPFAIDHAEQGMSCGGGMEGFINVVGARVALAIFGGGHIAQSLAKIAAHAGFYVTVIEDRAEFAVEFDGARYVVCPPQDYSADDPAKDCAYAVICTRGHATDAAALRYCLMKPLTYLGMIGSENKAAEVLGEMRREGVAQEALERVYTPIGLDIASQSPAEIAVAILAEILLVKNKGDLRHKSLNK